MHRRFEKRNSPKQGSTDDSELEQQGNGIKQNGQPTFGLVGGGITVNDTGCCTLCGESSVCKCERCGDFYCSPGCQQKDWPNHRFICFPMPRLVKAGHKPVQNDVEGKNDIPLLKADAGPVENSREYKRQGNKAPQSGFNLSVTALPPNGSCVILTGFKSSNRCYVRSANPTITEEYQQLLKTIDSFGQNAADLNGKPKSNTFALALKDDKWSRVQILSTRSDNNRIRIQFIDYGTIEFRCLKDLRSISGNIIGLPCHVNMIQLHGVFKFSKETNLLRKLNQYAGKEYKITFVDPDEMGGNVELYHWGTDKLLNLEINLYSDDIVSNSSKSSMSNNDVDIEKMGAAKSNGINNPFKKEIKTLSGRNIDGNVLKVSKSNDGIVEKDNAKISPGSAKKRNLPPPPKQIQIQKPCLEPPFEIIPLDENERNCSVIVVDSSYVGRGYLGCLLEKYCDNLKEITRFLNQNNNNGQSYKPKLNEYCLAQFDNEWYRAKVIEVLGEDKYQVVYIDFSNEQELTSESIRRYPMSLTNPCCTSLCCIEGLPDDLSDELIEFLEKRCESFQKLAIDRVKTEDGIIFIESKELLKALHAAKLI